MITVEIPGIGPVQVESEYQLKQLKPALNRLFADEQKTSKQRKDEIEKLQAAVAKLNEEGQSAMACAVERLVALSEESAKTQKAFMQAVVAALQNIQPVVNIEPPVINYQPPEIVIPEQKVISQPPKAQQAKPVKRIKVSRMDRDYRGLITEAEFEVIR